MGTEPVAELSSSCLTAGTFGDVLVVGAGISGIQAALDLADMGYKVYLVEKSPTIGGKMSQFDKTFPTNDCSMCIESPKFIECDRHPNIEILTYTEVERVKGGAGNFNVTLLKKPRYVHADRCTGCGACTEYCPVKMPDPYNQKFSLSKAIHIHFSQAVPLVSYIDPEACLFLKDEKCSICLGICTNGAIDFTQKPEEMEINVGAIILAPGYEIFDPSLRKDYGYGEIANVITSLDFERLLSSTGPYEGEILRPSDKKHPHNIAWIQCVGSRQVNPAGGNSYCSAVCCTYTQKQVILAKDHNPDAACTVFHNDIRAYGKDFERYYQRAEKLSETRFIRSYVSIGREIPESRNVAVRYSTFADGVREEEFDLVVLSVGLTPPGSAGEFACKFGIELNEYGFCKTNPRNPMETTRPGIFVSGVFQGPMDIPESVISASAAAALSSELLAFRRGDLATARMYPPERDVSGEENKIGVFVCRCGANIGRVIDVPSVVEYASTLGNVVHAQESLFACSTDNARQISDTIREKGLNRVVVAACTPRTHEPLFRDTVREGGINPYFFEFANIREHCAWVHSHEQDAATQKANDLIRMSVARAALLEPLKEFQLPVDKRALVVGGGVAGMTASLSLADQGFEVFLLERENELGGVARRLSRTLEGIDVQAFLNGMMRRVFQHPLIHVSQNAEIMQAFGFVGNFTTRVTTGGIVKEIHHGIAVIATGAEEYKPVEYLYGQEERVVTLLEMEEKIAAGEESLKAARSVVMIQCVGSREEGRNYCSRVCCSQAVKNALKLKEMNPEMEISILFRDMRMYGFKEGYYRQAAERDIKFIRYEPDAKPVVERVEENGRTVLRVTVADAVLGKRLAIDADYLALSAAVVPRKSSGDVSQFFKVPLNQDGFFQEAHVKLRPVEFSTEGVFLCGTAHYPKHLVETISQAYGAASRAATILSRDSVTASGAVCEVNEDDCLACGACISACTYGAIGFHETPVGRRVRVNSILCKGCGLCNAKCPAGAISLNHYTNDEVMSQIKTAFLSFAAVH